MKYKVHTLKEKFQHKGLEIECVLTQALNTFDHGHFNIVFFDSKTGDILHSNCSSCAPPAKVDSLDKKIEEFKKWEYDLIDDREPDGSILIPVEEPTRNLTKFWDFVAEANWKSDHDYKRISGIFKSDYQREELRKDYQFLLDELYQRFYDAWLGNDGGDGINASDDSWWDLRADVIGRGKKFYEGITKEQLQRMANDYDYKENFGYCFQK